MSSDGAARREIRTPDPGTSQASTSPHTDPLSFPYLPAIGAMSRARRLADDIKRILSLAPHERMNVNHDTWSDRTSIHTIFLLLTLLLGTPILYGCGGDDPGDEDKIEIEANVERDGEGGDENGAVEGDELAAEEEAIEQEQKEGKYRIRLAPNPGDVYSYSVVRDQRVSAAGHSTKQKQTFDVDMEVVGSNDDGSSVLAITYRRVRAEVTMPGAVPDSAGRPMVDSNGQMVLRSQTIRFDTKGKAEHPSMVRFKAFVGRRVLVTIDRKGNVRDVANVDPILNSTLKSLKVSSDTLNPKMLEAAKQGIRMEYGMLASLVFFNLAPDTAVTAGATWSRTDSMPVGGLPSLTTYAYTLKDVSGEEDPVANITGKLTTSPKLPKEPVVNEMLSMKITKLSVTGSADIKLDLTTGFPLRRSSTITTTMGGTGTMKAGPQKGESTAITMKERTATTITRTGYKEG